MSKKCGRDARTTRVLDSDSDADSGASLKPQASSPRFFAARRSRDTKKPGLATRRDQGYENWSWEAGASSDC